MPIEIHLKKTTKTFQLNIQFEGQSKRIGILGPSGSGKSMTLRCIAGIETPDQGRIQIDGRTHYDSQSHTNIKPQKRNIGYLFQNYALFPTMTVSQNTQAGLKGTKTQNQIQTQKMIQTFQLTGLENHLPSELSGGQQQRVALARIMAYQPDTILLDEPFSALDQYLKDQLQRELIKMLNHYQGTVIFVSHNKDEIYQFSQELLIIDQGKSILYNKTKDIFINPIYQKAARLTGCKNISQIQKIDDHTITAIDWGIQLHLQRPLTQDITAVGYQAHDFLPIWGPKPPNSLKAQITETEELPLQTNYYILPQPPVPTLQPICWTVQRESLEKLQKNGVPDYLQIKEEKLLYLK